MDIQAERGLLGLMAIGDQASEEMVALAQKSRVCLKSKHAMPCAVDKVTRIWHFTSQSPGVPVGPCMLDTKRGTLCVRCVRQAADLPWCPSRRSCWSGSVSLNWSWPSRSSSATRLTRCLRLRVIQSLVGRSRCLIPGRIIQLQIDERLGLTIWTRLSRRRSRARGDRFSTSA
jgi:hypothetical protein